MTTPVAKVRSDADSSAGVSRTVRGSSPQSRPNSSSSKTWNREVDQKTDSNAAAEVKGPRRNSENVTNNVLTLLGPGIEGKNTKSY
jgi:hypothetical protein